VVKHNLERLKLNGTHHLLVYAHDFNIVGENIDTIQKNTEAVSDASKKVGLELNAERTKCMLMSYCKKAGQKHSIKTVNKSLEAQNLLRCTAVFLI
jgi:hypothetical protein